MLRCDTMYLMAEPAPTRTITLREERDGGDVRLLWAYVDAKGLHIDGQDLGPGTAPVSDDGEYEWFTTYAPRTFDRIKLLLDGTPYEEILDVLERWVGRSYELERRLGESGIRQVTEVW